MENQDFQLYLKKLRTELREVKQHLSTLPPLDLGST